MPTDKRQRQKQARLERLEFERKAARRAASRRRLITAVLVGAGVFAILALIAFLSDGDDGDDVATTDSTTTTVEATTTTLPAEAPEVTVPAGPLPTELQITDLTVGAGPEAVLGNSVKVNYVGITASNGQQFESSFDSAPAEFTLDENSLIDGWVQGIPGMKVGGRRQLVIPPDLAYGETGKDDIGPNETLVFVIDLIAVA